ncbi:MAG TPA: hypothetical protein VHM92_10160 [Allosphingosinicella sp.]|nr:hypothetical protein [Allosphingosinicella sp.]
MPASTTLPIVAALSIIGSALGVSLGRSAIAEIDPAYFSDPEVPFHADLVANRGTDWAQVQALEYQQASVAEGLGTGCVGCRAYPAEYFPQHEPAVDYYAADVTPSTSASEPEKRVADEQDADRASIVRYASYRVSADEPAGDELEEEEAPVYAATE